MLNHFYNKLSLATRVLLIFTFVAVALLAGIHTGVLTPAEGLLLAVAPFPIRPDLLAVAVGYRNTKLIADEVLPRKPVSGPEFRYYKYPIGEMFTVPETKVGRKGKPNEVELTATEATDKVQDHALDDGVPMQDVEAAKSQEGLPDPEKRAAMSLTELIALAREKRTADLVFAQASYAAVTNRAVLAGATQWSDVLSDPVGAILAAFDGMVMRPSVAVLGRATHTKLSTHPKICKAVFGNNTDAGIVTRQQLAALFELDEWLVGEGWINTAKKGQPAVLARCWGKHAAFLHRNPNADTLNGTTFGVTAQWGGKVANSTFEKNIGMRGGMQVRIGESVKELVLANDLGFFFENAVA
jgi:hypothetical protein